MRCFKFKVGLVSHLCERWASPQWVLPRLFPWRATHIPTSSKVSWSFPMWSVGQTRTERCSPLVFPCWLWVSLVSWVFVPLRLTWFQLGVPENNTAASVLSVSWSSASGWTAGGLEFLCWPEDHWSPCPLCLLLTTRQCRPCGWRSSCCAFWHVRLWRGHGRRAWLKRGRIQGCFRNASGMLQRVTFSLSYIPPGVRWC